MYWIGLLYEYGGPETGKGMDEGVGGGLFGGG